MDKNIFIECFGGLKDKRKERTKLHVLLDIVALTLFAIMSGAQTFEEIEDFGELHMTWLKQYLSLPNGIPSHDTIRRVLGFLDHQQLIKGFISWITNIKGLVQENVVAIDGKTMKGSHKKGKGVKALHVLSAYSCANGLSLGQLKVDGKTNEITVIPELIKQLAIEGAIVTIDAMGCQKAIANAIIEQKADYLLAVKENQKELYDSIIDVFELSTNIEFQNKMPIQQYEDRIDSSHGRIEQRYTSVLPANAISHIIDDSTWNGIKSIVMIKRVAEDTAKNTCTIKISSKIEFEQCKAIDKVDDIIFCDKDADNFYWYKNDEIISLKFKETITNSSILKFQQDLVKKNSVRYDKLVALFDNYTHKNEITSDVRYFISSLPHTDVETIASAARQHWGIENKLHWTLDVTFKEDDCRIRDETAALNFAWIRKMALSFLKPILPFGKKVNSIRKKMMRNWARPDGIIDYINVQPTEEI